MNPPVAHPPSPGDQTRAPKVLVIVASTRPGRLAPAIATWFVEATRADATGVCVEIADLAEIGLPFLDEPEHPSDGRYVHEHTRVWSRQVAAADAFVIITPEYNYGMPAALKNALDYLYDEWAWKPVAFVSYGNTSAGTRSVQMTKQVVTTLRMVPIGATVALRIADSTRDGAVCATPAMDAAGRRVMAELLQVTQALQALRPEDRLVVSAINGVARGDDLAELLVLQRCCWTQEALANGTLALAPLHETLDEVRAWTDAWRVWCVRRNGRLVAAVRARAVESTWQISRLMVAPDLAGQGLGSWLLAYAERQAPADTTAYTLSTGRLSERNLALYERAGYELVPTSPTEGVSVDLTKVA